MTNTLLVEKAKEKALHLLHETGFIITQKISVKIDEKLPFMGYTTDTKENTPLIVVSKFSFQGGLIPLLIHEMSHIYRTQTKHPSHNFPLISKVIDWVLQGEKLLQYQNENIHNAVNCIEDLYADDIAFAVFQKFPQETFPKNATNQFFLNWIHKPLSPSTAKNKWQNAEFVVDASFAKANIVRHQIPDTNDKIEKAIEDFLIHIPEKNAASFEYFLSLMISLPEKISNESFGKLLMEYLREFLTLTSE